jgi:KDO2-lipid IV(A) lauroyltransferase
MMGAAARAAEPQTPAIQRRVTDGLLDTLGTAAATILGRLSWRTALRLGRLFGRIAGAIPGRRRARAIANLARAGSPDPRGASRRIRCHAGQTLLEILWSLDQSPEEVRRHMVIEGLDRLRAAAAAGRGVLLVSAHMGNWEMVAQAAAEAGAPVAVIAREMRTPGLQRRLIAYRERCGMRTVLRQHAGTSIAVARWLQHGGVFASMTDRASSGRRLTLPFLGATTKVPIGPFDLACRFGARVVVGAATRQPDGTMRITFTEAGDGAALDAPTIARRVMATLEQELGPEPERWLWIGRRQLYGDPGPSASPARR